MFLLGLKITIGVKRYTPIYKDETKKPPPILAAYGEYTKKKCNRDSQHMKFGVVSCGS
jgi:hypothetical protein